MNENDIRKLGKAIITLQKEAVNQTLLYWKPKAEQIIIPNRCQDGYLENELFFVCSMN